jgi:hypothetical protein
MENKLCLSVEHDKLRLTAEHEYIQSVIKQGINDMILKIMNEINNKKSKTKPIIRGNCKYCEVELTEKNVTIRKDKYMAMGRVCNICRRKLYRFYLAKPVLIEFMKRLNIDEDNIKKLLDNEKVNFIKYGKIKKEDDDLQSSSKKNNNEEDEDNLQSNSECAA